MAFSSTILVAAAPLLLWYLYTLAVKWRFRTRDGLVYAPRGLFFGAGKTMADLYKKRGDARIHSDYIFLDLVKSMGDPPIVIADFRPLYYQIAIINSHEVAEQITKASKTFPYSVPKSPTMGDLMPLIGQYSMLNAEDDTWKTLRRTYNQGFAPAHLVTLLPRIVEKTKIFAGRLDELVRSGEPSALDEFCVNLTFDIIGAVIMDVDLNAQLSITKQSALVRYYRELIKSYTDTTGLIGLPGNPFLKRRRNKLTAHIDSELKAIILAKHAEVQQKQQNSSTPLGTDRKTRPRSVLALSLQDSSSVPLSPLALQTTADTLKTFLFAGHDTTSILLQWAFYELSRSPHILSTLRHELDSVFGPPSGPSITSQLASPRGDELLNRLTYTSAIIKETLRLYPPAGSARRVPPTGADGTDTSFTVRLPDGQTACLDGFVLYSCHFLVQRDRAVYGPSADDFVPERWLGDIPEKSADQGTSSGVPPSAWRPFERGPRNCVGQELANLEARVILAVAARRYDFEKVGAGELRKEGGEPVVDEKGQWEVVSPMFNTRQVTAKPFDGMKMRVKFHEDIV